MSTCFFLFFMLQYLYKIKEGLAPMVRNIILTEMDITMLNLKILSNILKNEKEMLFDGDMQ